MKKTIIISILLLSTAWLQAQTVVIEETIGKVLKQPKNEKKIGYGTLVDITFYGGADQKGITGTLANSIGLNAYFNVKYKFHKNAMALAYLGVTIENYGFKKTSGNDSFPNKNNNNLEKYNLGAYACGLGMRVLTNKKAYLELGALAKWNVTRDLYVEKKDANGNLNLTTIKDLNYINQFNYDAYARLGYKIVGVVAYYRLNDMFSPSNIAPVVYEMPRLRVGITIGF